MNLAGRPPLSMAWSRALRAADSASRISPLNFHGGKRGRTHQFCEAVAFDQEFSWSDVSLRLLADLRAIPYLGPNLPLYLGRSVEHWRRLALLRSGEVEPYPCPPRAQQWGRKEFL